jgi:hypothetical protein
VSSCSIPQIIQVPVTSIPLNLLFFSIAKAFDAALKAKVLTFGGTSADQILCQRISLPSGLELVDVNMHCSGELTKANLYALRIVNIPDFSGCQAIISSSRRVDGLIFRIAVIYIYVLGHQFINNDLLEHVCALRTRMVACARFASRCAGEVKRYARFIRALRQKKLAIW